MFSGLLYKLCRPRWYTIFVRKHLHHTRKKHTRKIQYSVGVFTVSAICGAVVYLEIRYLGNQLSTVTDVFDTEKNKSTYIYLDPEKQESFQDTRKRSRVRKVKDFISEKSVKHLPWIYTKKDNPKSLLKLARSSDQGLRCLGVKQLSKHHDWEDYQYRNIAQALDTRTMIGLARSQDVDPRFFLPMPKAPPSKVWLEDEYRTLISSLQNEDLDKCLKHFATKALQLGNNADERDSLFSFGGTGLEFAKSVSSVPEERVEIVCLQALASHSADFRCCQNIIKMGGVQLLQQTYTKRHKSIVIRRQIAKTLGNLSVHQCFHEEIIRAGWVTVLSRWISSSDLTLSLHAARTLANLDTDFVSCTYEDGVYLIHPIYREKESINADIVFVHGLLGGPFKTWRQQDRKGPGADKSSDGTESVKKGTYTFCWPKDWLAKDCGNIRILSVEYDTDLSTWNANCPFETEKRSLTVRASSILQKLKKADIGSRPIIWVGHSMGGLLIKQILSIADDTPGLDNIVNNTVGVLFYSTPHRGSSLAHLSNQASLIVAPTVEVKEMGRDSPMLRRLHKDFQQLVMEHGIPCLSFGELEKTQIRTPKLKMLIVPPESSDPGIGEFHAMKTSHLNICKPWDRDSELYTETLKFIRRCLLQGRIENILKAGMTFKDSDR
ncbi:protein SERAC1-like [Mytilus galloprovincialis]|uniref:protein SERAC1-like n=1 Tax=Mytilus galloprovincialis TaxID=29158 RepID=UPI003F7CB1F0